MIVMMATNDNDNDLGKRVSIDRQTVNLEVMDLVVFKRGNNMILKNKLVRNP
jgi:hypothetical protein